MGAFLLCSAAFLCRHDYHGEPFFAEAPFAGLSRFFLRGPHSGKAQAFPLRHMKAACIVARLCKKACPRKPRPTKNAAFRVLPEKPRFRGCSHGGGEPSTPEQPSACGGCSHGEQRPYLNARTYFCLRRKALYQRSGAPGRPSGGRAGGCKQAEFTSAVKRSSHRTSPASCTECPALTCFCVTRAVARSGRVSTHGFLLFTKDNLVSALRGPRPAFRRPGRWMQAGGIHFRR